MTNFFCWFCQTTFPIENHLSNRLIKKTINNLIFTFVNCRYCQKQIYRWQVGKEYYYGPKIHVVLYEPEIVGNVGTIIRLAANFDFALHLIEPFGFIYASKWLKRSSANQIQHVKPRLYPDWNTFLIQNKPDSLVFTSANATLPIQKFAFHKIVKPLYLVFGRESVGLPAVLLQNPFNCCKISTTKSALSINLANSVSLVVYLVLLQFNMLNLF